MADRRVPVAILTGFLGSGKTTLLSRLLRHPGMGETAVIVNEFGEVAIDHHLLRRVDERTVVLASGCVCCTLRGDLTDELRDLIARRARGEVPPFRRIVVETTGLADPAPIVATIVGEPMLRHQTRLETVVATVDGVHGAATLERHDASVAQVAAADRLVVTKGDLAETEALAAYLGALNPTADVLTASFGDLPPRRLFGRSRGAAEPRRPPPSASHATGGVAAVTLALDGAVDWTAFGVWLTMLLQARGRDILRVKGLIDTGGAGPTVLDGVQHAVHPPRHLDAWPDGDRLSRIVFIGRGLDREALAASLAAFSRRS